jgi:hypothetical protein
VTVLVIVLVSDCVSEWLLISDCDSDCASE